MEKSVLLLMDLQERIKDYLEDSATLLGNVRIALDGARKAGVPVIFVRLSFEEGYPELSSNNKLFAPLKQVGFFQPSDAKAAICSEVAPLPGEPVISKKRISAFVGSPLAVMLRSMQVNRIVLSGFSTSGIVLNTFLEAHDMDLDITVLEDCCKDRDTETHQLLFSKIFGQRALVQRAGEWVKSL